MQWITGCRLSAPLWYFLNRRISRMSDFNDSLIFTLQQEGGFVNNIHDSGGATNFGITLATYREYQDDPDLSAEDLKTISTGIVSEIFLERFWNPMKCDVLPSGVDLMVFDHGVNAGISHSTKILQSCVGVVEDGVIGKERCSKCAGNVLERCWPQCWL